MSKTITALMIEQFGNQIPKFETDRYSEMIISQALTSHLQIKKSKQQIIQNLTKQLQELKTENQLMEAQCNQLDKQAPAYTIAKCAAYVGAVVPTCADIMKQVYIIEKDLIITQEKVNEDEIKLKQFKQSKIMADQLHQQLLSYLDHKIKLDIKQEQLLNEMNRIKQASEEYEMQNAQLKAQKRNLIDGIDICEIESMLSKLENNMNK
ncbi:Hypothetical_protein [Hexamita inflata]|uniref:Hypothetical_protein n=1 Tax=Hexamita inflata TaxID=28002 RepID=A0AA86QBW2_9EUKA|nr:Hypothetical protein HINF_LOCUS43866 [Hexamita inflata]